jgi:hypothetical protein
MGIPTAILDPIPDMSRGVSFLRKAIHRPGRSDRRQLSSLSFQLSTDGGMKPSM